MAVAGGFRLRKVGAAAPPDRRSSSLAPASPSNGGQASSRAVRPVGGRGAAREVAKSWIMDAASTPRVMRESDHASSGPTQGKSRRNSGLRDIPAAGRGAAVNPADRGARNGMGRARRFPFVSEACSRFWNRAGRARFRAFTGPSEAVFGKSLSEQSANHIPKCKIFRHPRDYTALSILVT